MTREERLTALFAHAYECINTKKDRSEDEYFRDTRFLDCFSTFIKNQVTTLNNERNVISVAFKGEKQMVIHVLRDDKGVCGEPSPNWRSKEHLFTRDTKRATCNNCIDMLNEEKESKK